MSTSGQSKFSLYRRNATYCGEKDLQTPSIKLSENLKEFLMYSAKSLCSKWSVGGFVKASASCNTATSSQLPYDYRNARAKHKVVTDEWDSENIHEFGVFNILHTVISGML